MYHTKSEHWQNEEFSAIRENVKEDEKVDGRGVQKGHPYTWQNEELSSVFEKIKEEKDEAVEEWTEK